MTTRSYASLALPVLLKEAQRRGLDVSGRLNLPRQATPYRNDPLGYAADVLNVHWWAKQQEIARALIEHRRVFVKASHSVGKTHLAGGLVNWFFDSYNPGLVLTTAPTDAQVKDVLWKEVRVQRRGRPGLQPKAPRMETSPDHFAVGYTAATPDAFQGRHEANVLIIFDECVGIDGPFWDAAEGMMTGANAYWLAICNPTDTATRAYEECLNTEKWHVMSVSALEHPNIAAALAGEPPIFPAAVTAANVDEWVASWCTPVAADDKRLGDIEWRGAWYRPGPLAESRMLGRWPSAGAISVWSELLWEAALRPQPLPDEPLALGCDVARFGDDFTSIFARRGPCALHHETHNGWSTVQTAGRLKQLVGQLVHEGEDPKRVLIKIDDDGVGGGVTDQADGWNFQGVSGASRAYLPNDYPNRRSEAWFSVAEMANDGRLDLSRLSPESVKLLRRQAMAPTWKLDSQGRRVVEPKDDTKKRIGRSPDDMDSLNLAYGPGKRVARIGSA